MTGPRAAGSSCRDLDRLVGRGLRFRRCQPGQDPVIRRGREEGSRWDPRRDGIRELGARRVPRAGNVSALQARLLDRSTTGGGPNPAAATRGFAIRIALGCLRRVRSKLEAETSERVTALAGTEEAALKSGRTAVREVAFRRRVDGTWHAQQMRMVASMMGRPMTERH